MTDIQAVIDGIEEWMGKPCEIQEITSGITNSNYKVTVENKSYVVRIPGAGTDMFISRDVELHNVLEASRTGVGAHVFRHFAESYIVIAEFLQGEVMSIDRFHDSEKIVRAVQAIKKVNTGASFVSDFIMFDKFKDYLRVVTAHAMKVPDHLDDAVAIVDRVEKRFQAGMPRLVSCHNDLLAENFIDTGDAMRIIDWEFSGRNDPCFELGDFSVEQGFGDGEDELIIRTYFGGNEQRMYARMKIYKSMADFLWTLYAMIQHHFSKLDFDFWKYGMDRFTRAMNAANTGDFSRWLSAV
jgi:thiamine kinase-like enzyme